MRQDSSADWTHIIRSSVNAEKVAFKKHSILRMRQRDISVEEFKEAMAHAEVIQFYDDDRPFPSALVLGFTTSGRPLHAVVALDEENEQIWIITLYEPSVENWNEEFKERRE